MIAAVEAEVTLVAQPVPVDPLPTHAECDMIFLLTSASNNRSRVT
jgi:hypothetical protein